MMKPRIRLDELSEAMSSGECSSRAAIAGPLSGLLRALRQRTLTADPSTIVGYSYAEPTPLSLRLGAPYEPPTGLPLPVAC
jgi:hypothetical protein